jgi:molybdopterin-guanine dinucleotide biosynthesis protein A
MNITGVIQAGGGSTRMGGQPKALMELGGRRISERVLDALRAAIDDVLVVTNTPELYAFLGLPMIADVYPHAATLLGRRRYVNVSGGRHYLPFGPSTVSGKQRNSQEATAITRRDYAERRLTRQR